MTLFGQQDPAIWICDESAAKKCRFVKEIAWLS